MPLLVIIAVVGLAVAAAVLGHLAEKKRREALAAWAAARGLTFSPARDAGFAYRYPAFGCLRRGDHRYAHHLVEGPWGGRSLCGFDYHYETHTTDSKGRRRTHHHRFSGLLLSSPVPLKPLSIRPERFFDKVTEFFGFDDIDFESAEFSRRFFVRAPDRKWAYAVLHPRAMERLLRAPVFRIEFARHAVLAYRSDRFPPGAFQEAADLLAGLLDALPGYLVKERTEGAAPAPRA